MNFSESLVAHVFVLRFPITTALLLVLLPVIALRFAKPLLANLFDLNELQAMAVTITACVAAWTSLITGWVTVYYGPTRFGLKTLPYLQIPEVPPWQSFALVCILPLPLLISAGVYSVRELATTAPRFLAGVAGGYAVAGSLFLLGWAAVDWGLNFPVAFQRHPASTNVASASGPKGGCHWIFPLTRGVLRNRLRPLFPAEVSSERPVPSLCTVALYGSLLDVGGPVFLL
jgi:hypothetical protein